MGVWRAERFVYVLSVPIPVTVAYAIVKYHLMDISLVIQRSTVYGTLSVFLAVTYFTVGLVLGSILPVSEYKETITTLVSTMVMVLTFVPARESVQHIIEKTLFHTKYSRSKILRDSTVMFSSIYDLNGLLNYAIRSLYSSVGIEKICILLNDEETQSYRLRAAINFSPENNLSFLQGNPIVVWLSQNRTVLARQQLGRFGDSKLDNEVEDILASMDVDSCIPIFRENSLFGIILLGKKVDKKPFTQEDIQMFLALSGQLVMAIHNAYLYARLKEAKTYRDNILESMRSGVIAVNNNEEVTLINGEARRILGVEDADSSGNILEKLGSVARQLLTYTLNDGSEHYELESVVEKGDTKTPCGFNISRLRTDAGEVLGALLILTDMTELKALEAEKQHADRLAAVGALAANIAHEIKNPLVAINTYFTLLPDKGDDKEFQVKFQKIAAKETTRINKIVEEMLNLARPSQSVMQFVDPHCAIRDAVNLLESIAAEKGAKITVDFEEKGYQISADEGKIKQVIINILQNSLEALAENGYIHISTGLRDDLYHFREMAKSNPWSIFLPFARSPLLDNKGDKQYFVVKISDNGIGIPPEKMPRLFEPFCTTKNKGTGLGLAIIYWIIKDHKGCIYVESRQGSGTDFYICLPLAHIDTHSFKSKVIGTLC